MPNADLIDGRIFLSRDDAERRPLAQRLNRIEGQIRGIRQMIEADRHCADELVQIKAAIAAMREVGMLICEQHVSKAAELANGHAGHTAIDDIMHVLREAARL